MEYLNVYLKICCLVSRLIFNCDVKIPLYILVVVVLWDQTSMAHWLNNMMNHQSWWREIFFMLYILYLIKRLLQRFNYYPSFSFGKIQKGWVVFLFHLGLYAPPFLTSPPAVTCVTQCWPSDHPGKGVALLL